MDGEGEFSGKFTVDGSSAISVIIFTTLGVAIALALIIPATRRRRKRMAAA